MQYLIYRFEQCRMHAECQLEVLTYIPMKQIYQQVMQVKGVTYEHEFPVRKSPLRKRPCPSQPMKSGPCKLSKKGNDIVKSYCSFDLIS